MQFAVVNARVWGHAVLIVMIWVLAPVATAQAQDDLDLLFSDGAAQTPADANSTSAAQNGSSEQKPGGEQTSAPGSHSTGGNGEADQELDRIPVGDAEAPPESKPTQRPRLIEEIIVTANRRVQNIQDVPSSIRAIDGSALEREGAAGFQDYIFKVPGADVGDSGAERKVAIRGISNVASTTTANSASTSPVGVYLNDVPIQGNGILPDLSLYDLQRVEVLKGPQGTLYGEGAMGGAIKMLLNTADPDAFAGKAEVGLGTTESGGGMNRLANFAVNMPVDGSWAVRLVGSHREDPGFVSFPNRGTEDEDESLTQTGRLHVDGAFGDALAASLLLFHQEQHFDQFHNVQLDNPDLTNTDAEDQFSDTAFSLAGLTLRHEFDFAELTSATSWFRNQREAMSRFPFVNQIVRGSVGATFSGIPVIGPQEAALLADSTPRAGQEWLYTDNDQNSLAQEFRLVSTGEGWLNWVAGGFYRTRENNFYALIDNDASDEPRPVGPGLVESWGVEKFEQFALFADATLRLRGNLELGLGLRGFREEAVLDGTSVLRGPLFPSSVAACECDSGENSRIYDTTTTALTPKLSLSWFENPERMLYLRVAKGTRSGGTNISAVSTNNLTPLFDPDSVWSYEIGAKSQWLEGLLTANAAVFLNNWTDMQILTVQTGETAGLESEVPVILNVGRAYTRGVELDLMVQPLTGLTVGVALFRGEGEIVEGDEAGTIPDHTPMPQLAELSYSAYADYRFADTRLLGLSPFINLNTQMLDERTMGPPNGLNESLTLDGFQTYNAIVGLAGSADSRWGLTLEARNLTDERAQVGAQIAEPSTVTVARPRTFITRLSVNF